MEQTARCAAAHLDLLALARQLRDAVERDDTDGLHSQLSRLRSALRVHVHAERPQLDALAVPAAAVALDGQRRLLRLVNDVLFTPADPDGGDDCNCIVRAVEIELALRRQAKLEAILLRRQQRAQARERPSTAGGG